MCIRDRITTELMRRGVTKEQVERIQEKYENGSGSTGTQSNQNSTKSRTRTPVSYTHLFTEMGHPFEAIKAMRVSLLFYFIEDGVCSIIAVYIDTVSYTHLYVIFRSEEVGTDDYFIITVFGERVYCGTSVSYTHLSFVIFSPLR